MICGTVRTPSRCHPRSLIFIFCLAALLAVFFCPTQTTAAKSDPTAAKRSDAQIQKLVEQLEKKLAKKASLKQGPGAILYRCFEFNSQQQAHQTIRNLVMLVNDPDSDLLRTRTLCYRESFDIGYVGGWIWRDGKVIRLEDAHWSIDNPGGQSPQDVVFNFPQLEKGDYICCSVEADAEYPFMGSNMRLSSDLPIMICNTRVRTAGYFSLEFLGHNLEPKKFAKKAYDEKDGYPIDTKFTVVDIPADRIGDGVPMFYEYQPHLLVYPKAQFNEMAGAWMETASWNYVAVIASNYRTQIQEKSSQVKARAQKLTAGLTTDAEKADALYDFVQNDIQMVCFFDDYHSSKLEDILASGKANRYGKAALMYAMCVSLDLPVDVLLSRDRQLGNIDRTACTMNQFTDFIVVLEGDVDRFYVPTTSPCPAGELPAGLKGLAALSTQPDLKDSFRELAIEASSRSASNPESSSAIFNSMLDQKDWSEWVILP